jgi:hypothetical protein
MGCNKNVKHTNTNLLECEGYTPDVKGLIIQVCTVLGKAYYIQSCNQPV